MWYGIQSVNAKSLKTLSEQVSKKPNIALIYRDMMEEIMECESCATPLYLKIAMWHDNRSRGELAMPPDLGELKTILKPRKALLK